jgi:hypothetical protein
MTKLFEMMLFAKKKVVRVIRECRGELSKYKSVLAFSVVLISSCVRLQDLERDENT